MAEADREGKKVDHEIRMEEIEKGVNAPVNAEATRAKSETDNRATLMKVEGDKEVKRMEITAKYSPESVLMEKEKDIEIARIKAEAEKEATIEVAHITATANKEAMIEVGKQKAASDKAAKIKSAEIAADAKPKERNGR